jgi:hypothetical protein
MFSCTLAQIPLDISFRNKIPQGSNGKTITRYHVNDDAN